MGPPSVHYSMVGQTLNYYWKFESCYQGKFDSHLSADVGHIAFLFINVPDFSCIEHALAYKDNKELKSSSNFEENSRSC